MTKQLKEMTLEELKGLLDEKYKEFHSIAEAIQKETNYEVTILNFYGVSNEDDLYGAKYVEGSTFDFVNLIGNDKSFKEIARSYLAFPLLEALEER